MAGWLDVNRYQSQPRINEALLWKLTAVYAIGMLAALRLIPMTGLFLDKIEKMTQNSEEILNYWRPFNTTLLMSLFWQFAMRFCFYRHLLPAWLKPEEVITDIINGSDELYESRKRRIDGSQLRFVDEVSSHYMAMGICLAIGLKIFVAWELTGPITKSAWNTFKETFLVSICFTYKWFSFSGNKIAKDFAEKQVASLFKHLTE